MRVVLASNNSGKVREFKTLLEPYAIDILPQSELAIPEVEETGLTFVENALLKARHAAKASGLPALADDSGLAVDALQGAPGIYSACYAGPNANAQANITKLLLDLKHVPDEKRTASFHCVLVFMRYAHDPIPLICHETWEGRIVSLPQGAAGFGYDPIFFVPSENKTAAELSPEVKNQISHRGKALRALAQRLRETACML